MYATMICLAAALTGVDFGYQPAEKEGMEFIIQIPPEGIESLKDGAVLRSDIPADVKNVRSWRILVGKGTPTRKLLDVPESAAVKPALWPSDLAVKPAAEHKVTFAQEPIAGARPEAKPVEEQPPQGEEPPRSWTLLTIVALLLFASLGGNLYLGWIIRDVHQRYRALLERVRKPLAPARE